MNVRIDGPDFSADNLLGFFGWCGPKPIRFTIKFRLIFLVENYPITESHVGSLTRPYEMTKVPSRNLKNDDNAFDQPCGFSFHCGVFSIVAELERLTFETSCSRQPSVSDLSPISFRAHQWWSICISTIEVKIVIGFALLMGTSCFRSGRRALIVVLLLAIYGGSGVFAQIRKPKNVQVAVQAKWSGTSVLLEAGYVCFHSPISVFVIVDLKLL